MTEPDRPAGAIPTEEDAVIIDVDEVEQAVETMIGEGEPLPVGANDPENQPDVDPPGMLHTPDDLDREMAEAAHMRHEQWQRPIFTPVRNATVPQARDALISDGPTYGLREALLRQLNTASRRRLDAISSYAAAVIGVQEARDAFKAAVVEQESIEDALYMLGLDVEADHEAVEPTAERPVVSDDQIV